MSSLEIRNLNKSFGALTVSRDISISIGTGQCHALIGPNGAGKTTLIHQISGGLRSDSGNILMDGQEISHMSVSRRVQAGLGRTFQITTVLPSFTALENTAIAAQAKSGSSLRFFRNAAREAALNEFALVTLQRVGLEHRANIPAMDLSHGELRLLELAIALAGRPKFLLLDEPMAGLGRAEGVALVALLASLRGSLPMLMVEHDMDAIFQLADTVSVLVDGSIVAQGTPDEVRADPVARAAYLGEAGK
ncbi:Lipopolysaccharide export system ATP-binding protein LptB [Sulfitobacter sp. DSM 110093]|uniref:ABC transporter ATP-binding protein n=1 Tax=Sulfitobacter sp. DSM 110093 TaxID=2883127 RepID=UPI001FAE6808|nr:ABC transporter ATP-binding protein [Sulfitobacter sp. DSM 110093]UOA32779.1 Lipopolysaccharide export system ATP-binding protein LptB [Sulfitobacter sp. DSM 110093]